jgi:predicted nucleic acid-binding protein
MRRVLVDTGAFVALRNAAEREHESARETLRSLLADGVGLFTSNYVFAETYTALLVRVGRHEAIGWGSALRASGRIEMIRVDADLEDRAWSILSSHDDK